MEHSRLQGGGTTLHESRVSPRTQPLPTAPNHGDCSAEPGLSQAVTVMGADDGGQADPTEGSGHVGNLSAFPRTCAVTLHLL